MQEAAISTLDAVKTFLAPYIHDHACNLRIHSAMNEQADRLCRQTIWTEEDSRTFKQINDRTADMLRQLHKEEHGLNLVANLLVRIYGWNEVAEQFPELWAVAGAQR